MGLLAGLLVGVLAGSAPFLPGGAGGDLGARSALAEAPDSRFRGVADDLPFWPSALACLEEDEDDEETEESDELPAPFLSWRAPGTVGAFGRIDRGSTFGTEGDSRCPWFLVCGRIRC